MNKKSTKALASATLMSLVLTTALTAGPVKAAAGSATRVSGSDRYETAANVATTNWTTSDNVVLVSGQGYADAVSASALAKQLNAPILLTTPDTLSSTTQAALAKLQAKNIYVVGGNASVSQSIRDTLKKSYTLTELSGATRYETNVAVANELVKLGVKKDNVLVVGGTGFSDALSVAPIASAKGEILLLANNNQSDTQKAIDFAKGSNVTVVGTSNVISDSIKNAFSTTATRVDGGADRFATNLNVLNNFKSDLKADKLYVANASGNGYADALVASAIAGKTASPLVLVDTDSSDATTNALAYIKNEATKTTDLEVVGGTGVVSDTLLNKVTEAVTGTNPSTAQVQSVSSNGLNQIKVVFNQEVDEDTAKTVANYKVDGAQLNDNGTEDGVQVSGNVASGDENSAKAVLQDDNKTVLITLSNKRKQAESIDVTVKKGILSKDKSQSIAENTQTVTFNDTTAPTITSAQARGNKKIAVEFSEPVNLGQIPATGKTVTANTNSITSKFKINDKNITSFGLDNTLSQVKDYLIDKNGNVWSNKVEFYFNAALPTGNNTLKVDTGDDKALEDSALFPIQEATTNFNVDTLSTTPKITSITAEDSGKIYINFDRPMDSKTAKTASYYGINGDDNKPSSDSDIELKKDDTQVKISNVSGKLNKNSNTIYIKNNVKDAYGNKVKDDERDTFTLSEDTTKPAVTSVTTLDDTTIRVRFNKDVDVNFAQNISNYKLRDNSGTDITATDVLADTTKDITNPGNSSDSASVFDIHMQSSKKLTDANYTLNIKNIRDTAKTPNIMDEKTIPFNGSGDVAPTVTGAYKVVNGTDASRKVVVKFSKEMDGSSLNNLASYKFTNGSGDVKALPSETDITPSNDNKSVTIKFPSSYGTDKTGDNLIKGISVLGVKDVNGNSLDVAYSSATTSSTTTDLKENLDKDTIVANSVKFTYSDNNAGDDLVVQFKYDTPIDHLNVNNFTVNGVTPSTATLENDLVKLTFTDGDNATDADIAASGFVGLNGKTGVTSIVGAYKPSKIAAVKFAGGANGAGAQIALKNDATGVQNTTDVSGNVVDLTQTAYAYDYLAAPKTIADEWYAGGYTAAVAATPTTPATSASAYVDVVFDSPIDVGSGINTDDFAFADQNGATLKADHVVIGKNIVGTTGNEANTVRFVFTGTAAESFKTAGAKISVNANSSVTLRAPKDKNDFNAVYAPSGDDKSERTVVVGSVGAVKGSLN